VAVREGYNPLLLIFLAGVESFTEREPRTMTVTKWLTCATLLASILLSALSGEVRVAAQERKKKADGKDGTVVKGTLASVDAEKKSVTITIHTFNRTTQEGTDTDKTFPLTKDAKILQDAVAAKLADLKKGYPVTLRLEGTSAASVSVDGGTGQGEFVSANLERNTVTVIAGRDMGKQVYHLLKTTTVTGGDGKAMSVKDLKAGTKLALTRSVEDGNTAISIRVLAASDK